MISLFLSPSTQEWNLYATEGNEQYWMNRIADAMMPQLRSSGINTTRNNPDETLLQAIERSNAGNYDLHLAIHSNAAPPSLAGRLRGADVYHYTTSKAGTGAAEVIAAHYRTIYPDPALVQVRGTEVLAELRRTDAPAVLIEVGYHDNIEDANWITDNIGAIAVNLVQSVAQVFGLPYIAPAPVHRGMVLTQGSPLLLRERPSTAAPVIARMPNGAQVLVTGQYGDWAVVDFRGTLGYAHSDYILIEA